MTQQRHLTVRIAALVAAVSGAHLASRIEAAETPNFVVIFCDDLGYGDLGCYGHPTIRTPNLDRMAAEGMKLTQFYSASPVCTPSRAALMTGRLPARNGMCSDKRRVLFPNSKGGIPANEITIAEALKAKGYATGCFGKWHLGHMPPYLPTNNGFDEYFGIPYSNDMDRVPNGPKGRAAFLAPKTSYWNVPIMRDEKIVERPADQTTITRRYTEEALRFIRQHRDGPFFVYLPHSMPHVPLFASEQTSGKSQRGLYGDVIEEIDWSVGQVLSTLKELKLAENTLVVFTSDNGPWLPFNEHGGSAGLLRGGKGSTWEGGMREPTIAWWPETVKASSISTNIAGTMDLYATFHSPAGAKLPADRKLDSYDLTPVLKGTGASKREAYFYYRGYRLFAVRKGPWKMHLQTQAGYGQRTPEKHDTPLLFHLEHDPSEKYDVAEANADVVKELQKLAEQHTKEMKPAPSQLEL